MQNLICSLHIPILRVPWRKHTQNQIGEIIGPASSFLIWTVIPWLWCLWQWTTSMSLSFLLGFTNKRQKWNGNLQRATWFWSREKWNGNLQRTTWFWSRAYLAGSRASSDLRICRRLQSWKILYVKRLMLLTLSLVRQSCVR